MTVPDPFTDLRLAQEQLAALRRQGFVSAERRRGRTVFKLRFRLNGIQHVRLLGSDPERAQAIRAALGVWQSPRRGLAEVQSLLAQSRAWRRSLRPGLAEQAAKNGFTFHGCQLRRTRAAVRAPPIGE